jgi:peptide/nickel transport system permease protein
MRVEVYRQTGLALLLVEGECDGDSRVWDELRTALSAVARRIAQQPGGRQAKLDLLPRIATAKATCQRLQDSASAVSLDPPGNPVGLHQAPVRAGTGPPATPWFAAGWQGAAREYAAGLGAVLAAIFAILKRVALFLIALLAVNAVAFLVANFLELRGPMAYNYVPDTQVAVAEVVAPYPEYLQSVLRGDFGTMRRHELRGASYTPRDTPILEIVFERLPRSLVLLAAAMLLAIVGGVAAGFLSVNYKTQQTNPLALILSIAGFSMPGFYMAILILYLMIWVAMSYGKGVFFLPTTGYGLDAHLVLPVLALAARPTAEIARLTAELLGEELPKDYIRVARAKGLPEWWIVRRHAFRNVVAAVVNAMSNSWSYVIGSLVIIERVFNWGGIGESLLDAVTFSQYAGSSFNPPLVATLATALALLFLLADLITTAIVRTVDPRLSRAGGGAA